MEKVIERLKKEMEDARSECSRLERDIREVASTIIGAEEEFYMVTGLIEKIEESGYKGNSSRALMYYYNLGKFGVLSEILYDMWGIE